MTETKRFQFSIRNLFVIIAFAALGCAGLKGNSQWWMAVIFTLTMLLYGWIVVRAVGMQGRSQVFSKAFAIIGIGYLALAALSMLTRNPQVLLTNVLLGVAENYTLFDMKSDSVKSIVLAASQDPFTRDFGWFFVIGHCMLSWFFALFGGWSAAWLYAKQQKSPTA